jgi:formiminoglutamase
MEYFNFYEESYLYSFINTRISEIKLGEKVKTISSFSDLEQMTSRFVIIGIPEDIGVRANGGKAGAVHAWQEFLKAFLNIQSNPFLSGEEIVIAGGIVTEDLMLSAKSVDQNDTDGLEELRKLTKDLDQRVYEVIYKVAKRGKIPIVIGGGHNNAYGILKGMSDVLKHLQPNDHQLNCINIDAHADLRPLEGRHSGNAFSYAIQERILQGYFLFGFHENYITQSISEFLQQRKDSISSISFEDIKIRHKITWEEAMAQLRGFANTGKFGLELDLDCIKYLSSSAKSYTGFSEEQVRELIYKTSHQKNTLYLHLPEAAPNISQRELDDRTGKLISYLVSDFIKAMS